MMYRGTTTPQLYHYENLQAPPIDYLLNGYDVQELNRLATSVRLAGNPAKKYKLIDQVMRTRGFSKLSGGTNRSAYIHPNVPNCVYKVALDKVGINDSPAEYFNQSLIMPYCTKPFSFTPCGTVGCFERYTPITTPDEFRAVDKEIYDIIVKVFLTRGLILEDFGAKFYTNWGIGPFGPGILDFPYVYRLDGHKLKCTKPMLDGSICGGEIDYDNGFNFLVCTKCGREYKARELADTAYYGKSQLIRSTDRKGGSMKITIKRGDTIVKEIDTEAVVESYPSRPIGRKKGLILSLAPGETPPPGNIPRGVGFRRTKGYNEKHNSDKQEPQATEVPMPETIDAVKTVSIVAPKNPFVEHEAPVEVIKSQVENVDENVVATQTEVTDCEEEKKQENLLDKEEKEILTNQNKEEVEEVSKREIPERDEEYETAYSDEEESDRDIFLAEFENSIYSRLDSIEKVFLECGREELTNQDIDFKDDVLYLINSDRHDTEDNKYYIGFMILEDDLIELSNDIKETHQRTGDEIIVAYEAAPPLDEESINLTPKPANKTKMNLSDAMKAYDENY